MIRRIRMANRSASCAVFSNANGHNLLSGVKSETITIASLRNADNLDRSLFDGRFFNMVAYSWSLRRHLPLAANELPSLHF
jgi:hypothetical protein